MKKADLKANHEPFDEALARYRSFVGKVIAAKNVVGSAQEKRDLTESVLLRLCANWERFVEEHLVDCVNRYPGRLSEHFGVKLPSHPTRDLCEALVIGPGYRSFSSTEELMKFSKSVLPDNGNPFRVITAGDRRKIDEAYRLRNYLSHYSKHSKQRVREMYRKRYNRKRFVEPGTFLLARDARRLWAYFDAFEGASSDMLAFW